METIVLKVIFLLTLSTHFVCEGSTFKDRMRKLVNRFKNDVQGFSQSHSILKRHLLDTLQLTRDNNRVIRVFNETIKENTKKIEQTTSEFHDYRHALDIFFEQIGSKCKEIYKINETVNFVLDTLHLTNESLNKMQVFNKTLKENKDKIEFMVANFRNYSDQLSNTALVHNVNNSEKISKINETVNFIIDAIKPAEDVDEKFQVLNKTIVGNKAEIALYGKTVMKHDYLFKKYKMEYLEIKNKICMLNKTIDENKEHFLNAITRFYDKFHEKEIMVLRSKKNMSSIENTIKPINEFGENIKTLSRTINGTNDEILFVKEQILENEYFSTQLLNQTIKNEFHISELKNKINIIENRIKPVKESFKSTKRLNKTLKENTDEIKVIKEKLYETEQYYKQSLNKSHANEIKLIKVENKINVIKNTTKPIENNTENIEKFNKSLNETKHEVNSIKKQILKTGSNYKKSFIQLQEKTIEILSLKEKINTIEYAIKPITLYSVSIQTLNKTIKERNDQVDLNTEQIFKIDQKSASLFKTADENAEEISKKLNKAIQEISSTQEKMNNFTSDMSSKEENNALAIKQIFKFLEVNIKRIGKLERVIENVLAHVCDVPKVRNASNNSSGTIKLGEKVVYKCDEGSYTNDQLVRTCGRNGLEPSLTDDPIWCMYVKW